MMRLIDADKLIDAVYTDFSEHFSDREGLTLFDLIREEIDNAPSVDAEPVRHAHWVLNTAFPSGIMMYKCSICGRYLSFHPENESLEKYPYCHCGAKMDEVTDDD